MHSPALAPGASVRQAVSPRQARGMKSGMQVPRQIQEQFRNDTTFLFLSLSSAIRKMRLANSSTALHSATLIFL
jgi:hypothetical protein